MLSTLLEICEGLACLHSRGIIHGDLKPANILLSRTNSVKLCDFGLSGVTMGNGDLDLSFAGCGTAGFMAPELLTGGVQASSLNSKIDIWALGSMIWSMVEMKEPFEDSTPSIFWIADFITSGKRPPLSSPGWSEMLSALVLDCWKDCAVERPNITSVLVKVRAAAETKEFRLSSSNSSEIVL
jgi:serine/threonine protein kinase